MITSFIRAIKRILLLLPAVTIYYFSYADIYPLLNKEIPTVAALIASYLLAAYVLIPLVIRAFRYLFRPSHVPLYVTTPDGFASDPLNIGIIGKRSQLIKAMEQAGWHQADDKNLFTMFRFALSMLLKKPYPNAPFSNLYLFGRSQDLGFQLPVNSNPRHRHHVRFWAASHTGDPRHLDHISFWESFHKSDILNEEILWVGAASLDAGLGIIRHNAQITHMIEPDTNAERDLITRQLKNTGQAKGLRKVKIGEPYKLTNRVLTGYLHTDGKMNIIKL